jgi:DtxR family transcriptional regulator, Mn-dependent transcriptional regulator
MEKLSQSLEDYLEAILVVSHEKKVVRVKDLVNKLNVKTASVIGALKKLEQKGFVEHEHYGYIELTPNGIKKANRIYEKHKILFRFLTDFLSVNKETAEKDACLIEHCISDETYDRIIRLLLLLETDPDKIPLWFEELKSYMKGSNTLQNSTSTINDQAADNKKENDDSDDDSNVDNSDNNDNNDVKGNDDNKAKSGNKTNERKAIMDEELENQLVDDFDDDLEEDLDDDLDEELDDDLDEELADDKF